MPDSPQDAKRDYKPAIVGIALITALGFGLFKLISWIASQLSNLDSNVAAAIVAAAATVLVSVVTLLVGKAMEVRTEIREEHRRRKIPVYESLIKFMSRATMGEKVGKKPTEAETLEFFIEFTQDLMIWGSNEVISSWVEWRKTANENSMDGQKGRSILYSYEDLVFAIRKDLGHRSGVLEKGDMLRLFVNDLD